SPKRAKPLRRLSGSPKNNERFSASNAARNVPSGLTSGLNSEGRYRSRGDQARATSADDGSNGLPSLISRPVPWRRPSQGRWKSAVRGQSEGTTIVRSSSQSPEARRTSHFPRATPVRARPFSSVLNQEPIPAVPDRFWPPASTHCTSALFPTSTQALATG